jgi:hypothetical protein
MGQQDNTTDQPPGDPTGTAFSNAIRLSCREWLFVGLFAVLLAVLAPRLWQRVEAHDLAPDGRMPHDLSNDYWLFERYADAAAERYDTLLLGDSVVWGEYVTGHETLSHYLNEKMGRERCANLGLDGAHPLALAGLIEHYAGGVTGKEVILLCNPLWLSSARADLQDDRETDFNHPRLVPQFRPQIPSYPLTREKLSERIGIVVEQHLPLSSWAGHLQQAYYDRSDLSSWTLEHPYANPVGPLLRGLPPADDTLRHQPQPWYKSGIARQDYPWVDPDASLQWPAFQRAVRVLQDRGNKVFVVVGPFNEHLLTPASRGRYQKVKAKLAAWLTAEGIPHALPRPLPSELYGDASHPLARGYALLARRLIGEPFFRRAEASGLSAR